MMNGRFDDGQMHKTVSKQNGKSQRPLEKWRKQNSGEGVGKKGRIPLPLPLPPLSFFGSRFISRTVKTENPYPRSFLLRNQNETLATQGTSKLSFNPHISLPFLEKKRQETVSIPKYSLK